MPRKMHFDDVAAWRSLNIVDNPHLVIQLVNCRTVREEDNVVRLVDHDHVWVENGRILNAEEMFFDRRRVADVQIDCDNHIVAAGYIDVQVNGACGVDFSSYANCATLGQTVDEDGLRHPSDPFDAHKYAAGVRSVGQHLLSYGVTSYCPTLVRRNSRVTQTQNLQISSTSTVYASVLPRLRLQVGSPSRGAHVLGAHCEGPFITHPGCHPKGNIRSSNVDESELDAVYGRHNWTDRRSIKMVTLAPDIANATNAIRVIRGHGVTVSLGHTRATLEQAECGVMAGASAMTHLYNAMNVYHHRSAGMIGLLASECVPRTLHYGLIVDGLHVLASAVRIAWRTNPNGLVSCCGGRFKYCQTLVSDAIAALGRGDGRHMLGDLCVHVDGMRASIDGRPAELAGAVAPLDYCVRKMWQFTKCRREEAIVCASLHPARMVDMEGSKGSLNPGCDADINILDDDLNVLATYVNGDLAHTRREGAVNQSTC